MTLRSPTDVDEASAKWGANCGPAAIAAAFGLELAQVKAAVSKHGRFPGHMGIPDVERACKTLGRPCSRSASDPGPLPKWPRDGTHLAMIEIDGPWRGTAVAPKHRHLISASWREYLTKDFAPGLWMVYDVNALEWIGARPWSSLVMNPIAAEHPGSTGRWSFSWRGALAEPR